MMVWPSSVSDVMRFWLWLTVHDADAATSDPKPLRILAIFVEAPQAK